MPAEGIFEFLLEPALAELIEDDLAKGLEL